MKAKYTHLTGKHEWSENEGLVGLMRAAGSAIVRGEGPFRLFKNGELIGNNRKRLNVLAAVERQARFMELGDSVKVSGKYGRVFTFRMSVPALEVIDTSGNDKVDLVWSTARQFFPKCTFLGAYVCKNVAGTSTHSQHSYGNAVDIGAKSMMDLVLIANEMVLQANRLNIEHVIVQDKIWKRGAGWTHYSGEYHYHVHVDCNPNIDPKLPCGVRG